MLFWKYAFISSIYKTTCKMATKDFSILFYSAVNKVMVHHFFLSDLETQQDSAGTNVKKGATSDIDFTVAY